MVVLRTVDDAELDLDYRKERWRLLGRTPLVLFDAARTSPALFSPGDRVRFQRIGLADFDRLRKP